MPGERGFVEDSTGSPKRRHHFTLRLSQVLSPKPTKRDMVSPGGTRLETALKTGRNWNDETAEPLPSSGNRKFLSYGGINLISFRINPHDYMN